MLNQPPPNVEELMALDLQGPTPIVEQAQQPLEDASMAGLNPAGLNQPPDAVQPPIMQPQEMPVERVERLAGPNARYALHRSVKDFGRTEPLKELFGDTGVMDPDTGIEDAIEQVEATMYMSQRMFNYDKPLIDKPEFALANVIIESMRGLQETANARIAPPVSFEKRKQELFQDILRPVQPMMPPTFQDIPENMRLFAIANALATGLSGNWEDAGIAGSAPLNWWRQNVQPAEFQAQTENRKYAAMAAEEELRDIARREGLEANRYSQEQAQKVRAREAMSTLGLSIFQMAEKEQLEMAKLKAKADPQLKSLLDRHKQLRDSNSDQASIAKAERDLAAYFATRGSQTSDVADLQSSQFWKAAAERTLGEDPNTFQQLRGAQGEVAIAQKKALEALSGLRNVQAKQLPIKNANDYRAAMARVQSFVERTAAIKGNFKSLDDFRRATIGTKQEQLDFQKKREMYDQVVQEGVNAFINARTQIQAIQGELSAAISMKDKPKQKALAAELVRARSALQEAGKIFQYMKDARKYVMNPEAVWANRAAYEEFRNSPYGRFLDMAPAEDVMQYGVESAKALGIQDLLDDSTWGWPDGPDPEE